MTAQPPREAAANTASASTMRRWLAALALTARIGEEPQRIFATVIEDLAAHYGHAPALLSDAETLSFADLAVRARRYARWGRECGLMPGDTVCLLMPNRPDYVAAWVGLSRIGCVVALLNTNLVGEALAHCLSAVEPKLAIVADSLMPAYAGALPHLLTSPGLWIASGPPASGARSAATQDQDAAPPFGATVRRNDLETALVRQETSPFSAGELPAVSIGDPALYIYTSGTTGLPKAARVSHRRVMTWSYWFAGLVGTTPQDRLYNCLPLYHSVGGIVAVGSVLVGGGSVVIREKFSASRFWDDIRRWDCSLFQYIGELCRYLLAAPPQEGETTHRLRLACGNGLRADVWSAFQQRFMIPTVLEFYAATEGNFSLFNVEGQVGSIGRIPSFLAHRFPAAVVRFDPDRGEPLRTEQGLCVRCARNEPGEAIGFIGDASSRHGAEFEGYTNAAETDRKILRDVFKPGDRWFRTGDLMRVDERGFYYFVDRVGDSFRWKGENVATSEVAAALLACPGVAEANVYGVSVPGAEGKAGMAALVAGPDFSLADLHAHVAACLPAYARPLFLRLQKRIDVTETFKPKSGVLARQGFDPAIVEDPLFFADATRQTYRPLDADLYAEIVAGRIRL